jgi:hypothetical protein
VFPPHSNYSPSAPIVTPAYDTDGNPAAFSAGELSSILAIWRGVSEDYAPFDVDVTTEEPVGLPLSQWVRAVIGGDSGPGNCECRAAAIIHLCLVWC